MTRTDLEARGHLWLRGAIAPADIAALIDVAEANQRAAPGSPLWQAAKTLPLFDHLRQLWPGLRIVRLISFDKSDGQNWSLDWHQDRGIAVKKKKDMPGFSNWSRKGAIWHCEPPACVLDPMLFLRLHLDEQSAENGAMDWANGSHQAGLCTASRAAERAECYPAHTSAAQGGDVLVLPMLTLHRSGPNKSGAPRRALRVDCAMQDLPPPLQWFGSD